MKEEILLLLFGALGAGIVYFSLMNALELLMRGLVP